MKIHVIAIGGSIMHSLAIQLKLQGHEVTGSDDLIYDPAKSRLIDNDLLPSEEGWFAEKVHAELDLVVVGKHAHSDNVELKKAQELNLVIRSFPEFVYERTLDKKRIAIAGSHGKTTTTAMMMEMFSLAEREFDYLIGAKLQNFDRSFKLTASAPYILIEADEYPTSSLDPSPKFIHYKPHYSIITGVAWDHMNAFPTLENYIDQFRNYLKSIRPGGHVIYNQDDAVLKQLVEECDHIIAHPYGILDYRIENGTFILSNAAKDYPIRVIGKHNVQNMTAVSVLARLLDFDMDVFYQAMANFETADKRLQTIVNKEDRMGIIDFAHAPSKVAASINAVKSLYPDRKTIAVIELHTYSSLNKEFLKNYKGMLDDADKVIVYYSPKTLEIKRLPNLNPDIICSEMGREDIDVFTDPDLLYKELSTIDYAEANLLMMSSGAFGKDNVRDWIKNLLA